jgi:hypothetical protein
MPNVATMPKDATFFVGEPRDAIKHDTKKPTPSFATPSKDATFSTDEPRDATGHKVEKPTPRVETPIVARRQKMPYLVLLRFRMPVHTTLNTDAERRNAETKTFCENWLREAIGHET